MADVPEMEVLVLAEALNSANPPVVLDVREASEFAEFPLLDGALHIPLAELPGRMLELPADTWIAVVCRSGGRSAKATALLNDHGFEAVNVLGGMTAWAALQG
jgi:rhodanese-related sulfurtransferase